MTRLDYSQLYAAHSMNKLKQLDFFPDLTRDQDRVVRLEIQAVIAQALERYQEDACGLRDSDLLEPKG